MVHLVGPPSGQQEPAASSDGHIATRPDDLSNHAHRQLIGYIGLILPLLLCFLVLARDGPDRWRELDSISAYYYTGAVAAFVGMLVALSLFLFTYRGYRNRYGRIDRAVSVTAAVAALGVALFPTDAPGIDERLSWWQPLTGWLHYGSAAVLFTMFALYALWLFRLCPPGETPSPGKRMRNRVYLLCGLVIVAAMGWTAYAGLRGDSDRKSVV